MSEGDRLILYLRKNSVFGKYFGFTTPPIVRQLGMQHRGQSEEDKVF